MTECVQLPVLNEDLRRSAQYVIPCPFGGIDNWISFAKAKPQWVLRSKPPSLWSALRAASEMSGTSSTRRCAHSSQVQVVSEKGLWFNHIVCL